MDDPDETEGRKLYRAQADALARAQISIAKRPVERMFPIMKWSRGTGIPWRIIAPHEQQALKNHEQTLQRLAERGGLDPSEAIAVLLDHGWSVVDMIECDDRLLRIVANRGAAASRLVAK